jgi:leucyl/phenylalanyl-tRNA---protein transferase
VIDLELNPQILLRAYCMGIFPMGDETGAIRWYSPNPRCIFDFDYFHIPSRLARTYRSGKFEMRVNTAWDEVLWHCADRDSTWINQKIVDVYTELYRMGFAHSVEAYNDQGKLAGGLYGVSIGGAFFGESMFHIDTDASKVSLVYLVERMKSRGMTLLDSQFMTTHLSTFGAVNISRNDYMQRLNKALLLDCKFA